MASSTAVKIRCYSLIIKKLKESNFCSKKELSKYLEDELAKSDYTVKVGTSAKSVGRLINDIDELFDVIIEYSNFNKGYHISSESNRYDYLDRLIEQFELLETLKMANRLKEFVFLEKRKSNNNADLINKLIIAIKNSKRVEFSYHKFDNITFKERRLVEPYAIKEFKNRWYLLAVEINGRLEERGQIKTWGLDRIDKYILVDRFIKKEDLNIEDEFKNAFGIFSNEEKDVEEVVLSFTAMNGKYIKALPLHETQDILFENENELRIKLNVKITYDFIMELLSQSQGMKVIAPIHLKDKLIEIHQEAIKSLQ